MLPGCKDEDERADDGAGTTSDDGADDLGTGTTESHDDGSDDDDDDTNGEEIDFQMESVFGTPNLDDDDENGQRDWLQLPFEGDNDLSQLTVPGVPEGYRVELVLSGDLEHIRIWDANGGLIGHGSDPIQDTLVFAPGPEGTVLDVEFAEYNVAGTLLATVLDPNGAEAASTTIDLHSSPMIMNHHLQPTEEVWVVEVSNWGGNASMVADLEAVLGDKLTKVPGNQVGLDVWIQDEIELATSVGANGTRLDTMIDSIRERGLGVYPKATQVYPDSIPRMWGSPASATTFDAFGNLEASPPVTVGDVEYPFGRIYYGKEGPAGLDDVLANHLDAQTVQNPFHVNTSWLCVGHIDEISSFVPDSASPKGFKFLFSDVGAAVDILEGMDPATSLPRFGLAEPNGHGIPTVNGLLTNSLRAFNEDRQALYLDPIRERFIAELGLDEEDIVDVPTWFEPINCGPGSPHAVALVPGTVNLLVANLEDASHLFIADPFVRSDLGDQSSDPFIQDFVARMPRDLQVHFVDNWFVYHMGLGEVHCATNARRTPSSSWFETAMHLLEN